MATGTSKLTKYSPAVRGRGGCAAPQKPDAWVHDGVRKAVEQAEFPKTAGKGVNGACEDDRADPHLRFR